MVLGRSYHPLQSHKLENLLGDFPSVEVECLMGLTGTQSS